MIGWILLAAFAVLSYGYSWWFVVGVVVFGLWKLNRWYYHNSRPWRRVHFPMMRAYAGVSGLEAGEAEREGREFNLNAALLNLLKMVNPKIGIGHEELIQREFERCNTFYDESLIREYLTEKKGLDLTQVSPVLGKIKDAMHTSDKGLMVRMVIASVIEEQFSPLDRGEYMFQVFNGKAT
jgi:hypothetical protein